METLIQDAKLNAFVNNEIDINRGGCGIYALAVARYLMNRGIDKLELVTISRESDVLEKIYENNNIINNVPNHVVLKSDEYCFDAEGVFEYNVFIDKMKADCKDCITIDFTERDLIKAINHPFDWNPWFERNVFVPRFEQNFNISLQDIIV